MISNQLGEVPNASQSSFTGGGGEGSSTIKHLICTPHNVTQNILWDINISSNLSAQAWFSFWTRNKGAE